MVENEPFLQRQCYALWIMPFILSPSIATTPPRIMVTMSPVTPVNSSTTFKLKLPAVLYDERKSDELMIKTDLYCNHTMYDINKTNTVPMRENKRELVLSCPMGQIATKCECCPPSQCQDAMIKGRFCVGRARLDVRGYPRAMKTAANCEPEYKSLFVRRHGIQIAQCNPDEDLISCQLRSINPYTDAYASLSMNRGRRTCKLKKTCYSCWVHALCRAKTSAKTSTLLQLMTDSSPNETSLSSVNCTDGYKLTHCSCAMPANCEALSYDGSTKSCMASGAAGSVTNVTAGCKEEFLDPPELIVYNSIAGPADRSYAMCGKDEELVQCLGNATDVKVNVADFKSKGILTEDFKLHMCTMDCTGVTGSNMVKCDVQALCKAKGMTPSRSSIIVYGDIASVSQAICPDGYRVDRCECEPSLHCFATEISFSDPKKCEASGRPVHSMPNRQVSAKARCITTRSPRNTIQKPFGLMKAKCDGNHRLLSCAVKYIQSSVPASVPMNQIITKNADMKVCDAQYCTSCSVQAVCRSGETQYMAKINLVLGDVLDKLTQTEKSDLKDKSTATFLSMEKHACEFVKSVIDGFKSCVVSSFNTTNTFRKKRQTTGSGNYLEANLTISLARIDDITVKSLLEEIAKKLQKNGDAIFDSKTITKVHIKEIILFVTLDAVEEKIDYLAEEKALHNPDDFVLALGLKTTAGNSTSFAECNHDLFSTMTHCRCYPEENCAGAIIKDGGCYARALNNMTSIQAVGKCQSNEWANNDMHIETSAPDAGEAVCPSGTLIKECNVMDVLGTSTFNGTTSIPHHINGSRCVVDCPTGLHSCIVQALCAKNPSIFKFVSKISAARMSQTEVPEGHEDFYIGLEICSKFQTKLNSEITGFKMTYCNLDNVEGNTGSVGSTLTFDVDLRFSGIGNETNLSQNVSDIIRKMQDNAYKSFSPSHEEIIQLPTVEAVKQHYQIELNIDFEPLLIREHIQKEHSIVEDSFDTLGIMDAKILTYGVFGTLLNDAWTTALTIYRDQKTNKVMASATVEGSITTEQPLSETDLIHIVEGASKRLAVNLSLPNRQQLFSEEMKDYLKNIFEDTSSVNKSNLMVHSTSAFPTHGTRPTTTMPMFLLPIHTPYIYRPSIQKTPYPQSAAPIDWDNIYVHLPAFGPMAQTKHEKQISNIDIGSVSGGGGNPTTSTLLPPVSGVSKPESKTLEGYTMQELKDVISFLNSELQNAKNVESIDMAAIEAKLKELSPSLIAPAVRTPLTTYVRNFAQLFLEYLQKNRIPTIEEIKKKVLWITTTTMTALEGNYMRSMEMQNRQISESMKEVVGRVEGMKDRMLSASAAAQEDFAKQDMEMESVQSKIMKVMNHVKTIMMGDSGKIPSQSPISKYLASVESDMKTVNTMFKEAKTKFPHGMSLNEEKAADSAYGMMSDMVTTMEHNNKKVSQYLNNVEKMIKNVNKEASDFSGVMGKKFRTFTAESKTVQTAINSAHTKMRSAVKTQEKAMKSMMDGKAHG